MYEDQKLEEIYSELQAVNENFENSSSYAFLRHIDNNTSNDSFDNLQWVTLADAIENPEWTTDLPRYLTEDQIEFLQLIRPLW